MLRRTKIRGGTVARSGLQAWIKTKTIRSTRASTSGAMTRPSLHCMRLVANHHSAVANAYAVSETAPLKSQTQAHHSGDEGCQSLGVELPQHVA